MKRNNEYKVIEILDGIAYQVYLVKYGDSDWYHEAIEPYPVNDDKYNEILNKALSQVNG